MKKYLFLYSELAGYMHACMKHLAVKGDAEVHVIMYPVNSIAPFRFKLDGEGMFYYQRNDFPGAKLLELCRNIQPDIIFCSGWIDKDYLAVCNELKIHTKIVMALDNPWRSTLRQHIAALFGPAWLRRYFTHCWVAGLPQKTYALKLGFKAANIKEGLYSCDYEYYYQQYLLNKSAKQATFPKKIIYVGRYAKLKGVRELWKAFEIFQKQTPNEWELWCLGKGEYEPDFPRHPKIKNFGFIQPADMQRFLAETGVFILPAHYEHWGVVVHEFASAGFPLVCSNTTSAALKFLEEGKNGYFHDPCSVDSIVDVLGKVLRTNHGDWIRMGDHSAELAKKITPETWSQTAIDFLEE